MKTKTEAEMREILRRHVAIEFGSHRKFAEFMGVSNTTVSKVIKGSTPLPSYMADYLGYEPIKTTKYRKLPK